MTLRLTFTRTVLALAATAPLALGLAGCWGQTSEDPPIVPLRNMHEQPRYDPQSPGRYFADGRAMRQELPHTVAREAVADPIIDTGVDDEGHYVLTIPEPVIQAAGGLESLARRGHDRFEIYCVPCHGGLGDGLGMVPEVAQVPTMQPPTFHDQRVREMPDGQLYATIRNGIRNMPTYRHSIPVNDRWAIVAYVRALQINQLPARTAQLDSPATAANLPGSQR